MLLRFLAILAFGTLTVCSAYTQPNALEFDGSDDYVLTKFTGPTGSKPRTIECWIKTYYKQKQQVLVDYGGMSPNGSRFTFNMIDGKLRIEVGGEGKTGTKHIADTSWHHVAVTYDKNATPNFRTFIDGKVQDSFSFTIATNTSSATKLKFGTRADYANFFRGTMDEIRVWNYARNHQQIRNNYSKEFCQWQKGLVAYHKLNQGNAGKNNQNVDESIDFSKNGQDGELKNFALTGSGSNWVSGYGLTQGSTTGSATVSGCGKYKSPSKKYTWTKSGTYKDTIKSFMGCDSVISLSVTVIPNPTKTINATSCKVYISPSGQYAWNKTGTYTDRLMNPNGCDTIVTVNLIVSGRSFDTVRVSTCNKYVSPSGKHIWISTGTYNDTLSSRYGCDSIITTHLNILKTDTTLKPVVCGQYTAPSGSKVWSVSGLYADTLMNSNNCDSVITIDLTVNQPSSSSISVFECTQYTAPSGKYVYNTPGIFSDTISNSKGCDSVISISLTLGEQKANNQYNTCGVMLSPSGKFTWTESGTYSDTISTVKGCDSIITAQVTILEPSSASVTWRKCEEAESPSGRFNWTTSGTYYDTLTNYVGCDSVIEVDLTIDNLGKVELTMESGGLKSVTTGDSYQWIDCLDNNKPIAGQTGQTYNPAKEGEYAVEVTKGACTKVSECILFLSTGERSSRFFEVYPNPSNGQVRIETSRAVSRIEIYNSLGQLVYDKNLAGITHLNFNLPDEPGVYFIKVSDVNGVTHGKQVLRK